MSQVPNYVSYGLSQPLIPVAPRPKVALRAPTTSDKAPIGQLWIYTTANASYILTSIVNNLAQWSAVGAGSFSTLTVSGAALFSSSVSVGTTLGVVGNTTLSSLTVTGNAVVEGIIGNVSGITSDANIAGATLYSQGDLGGVAMANAITNIIDSTLSTGVMTIHGTTANAGNSAGFIKGYVGVTPVWIPYFTNIAP